MKVKKTGELFLGKHKPLITKTLYDLVQDRLDGKTSRKKKKHTFMFSRSIRCLHCKYSLIAEKQKGYVYYRCQTKKCPTQTIRESALLTQYQEFLKAISFPTELMTEIKSTCSELIAGQNKVTKEKVDSLKFEINKLEKRENSLIDALLDDLIPKSDFQLKKAEINKQVIEFKRKLSLLEKAEVQITEPIEKFLELSKSLTHVSQSGKPEQICDLVKKVSSNLFLDRKKLLLEPISAYSDILHFEGVLDCCLSRDRPPENKLICLDCFLQSNKKLKKKQSDAIAKSIVNYCIQ